MTWLSWFCLRPCPLVSPSFQCWKDCNVWGVYLLSKDCNQKWNYRLPASVYCCITFCVFNIASWLHLVVGARLPAHCNFPSPMWGNLELLEPLCKGTASITFRSDSNVSFSVCWSRNKPEGTLVHPQRTLLFWVIELVLIWGCWFLNMDQSYRQMKKN